MAKYWKAVDCFAPTVRRSTSKCALTCATTAATRRHRCLIWACTCASTRRKSRSRAPSATIELPITIRCAVIAWNIPGANSTSVLIAATRPFSLPLLKYCPFLYIVYSSHHGFFLFKQAHLKNKHPDLSNELIFSCQMCNFRTIRKETLEQHVTTSHSSTLAKGEPTNNEWYSFSTTQTLHE